MARPKKEETEAFENQSENPEESIQEDTKAEVDGNSVVIAARLATSLRSNPGLTAYVNQKTGEWFFNESTALKHFKKDGFVEVTHENL